MNSRKNFLNMVKERTADRIAGARLFQQRLGPDVPVIGWIEGPLAEACDLVGVSEMLMKLALNPEFSRLLLAKMVPAAVIEQLSAAEVYDRAKILVESERGRPFILSAGCEITPLTPPENLMAMRTASRSG